MGLTLAPPARQIPLTKFGGLYTEADPRSLPAGSAYLCNDCDFLIARVGIRPGLSTPISAFSPSPGGTSSWEYLKSTRLLGDVQQTLAENSDGSLWYENLTSEGTLTQFYTGILNSARAISKNVSRREYICLSDLIGGSDQPRQWDGTNLDRISQVGPGQAPDVPAVTGTTYTISSISQPYAARTVDSISWGSSINLYTASPTGTNLYFMSVPGGTTFLQGIYVGDYVYVSGAGKLDGYDPNGTYKVLSTGSYTDPTDSEVYQYIQVTASQSNSDFARHTAGGTLQKTQAVIELTVPLDLEDAVVSNQITIADTSVQQWNTTWTIIDTPAEGQLSISATSLTSNVATYDYTLVSGNAPGWQASHIYNMGSQIVDGNGTGHVWQVTTPGTSGSSAPTFPASPSPGATVTDGTSPTQITWTYQSGLTLPATVFNTSNGNGVFNIQAQEILSASSTTFTVAITNADVSSAAESGQAVTGSGSVLIIDPGTVTVGSGNPGQDPIYGTSTGGEVLPVSSQVAAGERYAVMMFLTRNDYLTPASPPVRFYTTGQSKNLKFTNLAIGPPNIIARVIAITAANAGVGGPYYYIPEDVVVPASSSTLGLTTTVTKTVVEDNTSTESPTFTITDDVLINSIDITASGNNRLQVRELGECVKCEQFKGRAFYIGERVKIDAHRNLTFDGGVIGASGALPQLQQQSSNPQHNWWSGPSYTISLGTTPPAGDTLVFVAAYSANNSFAPPYASIDADPSLSITNHYRYPAGGDPSPYVGTYKLMDVWVATADGSTSSWTFTTGNSGYGQFNANGAFVVYHFNHAGYVQVSIGDAGDSTSPLSTDSFTGNSYASALAIFYNDNVTSPTATWTPSSFSTTTATGGTSSIYTGGYDAGPTIAAGPVTMTYASAGPYTGIYASIILGVSSGGGGGGGLGYGHPAGWTLDGVVDSYIGVVDSDIVNTALEIDNTSGSALSGYLYQGFYDDGFGNQVVQPNTAYSVRVTARAAAAIASGFVSLELYSPSSGTWGYSVPLTSLTTSLQEIIGALNNPLWTEVPSDLQFRVVYSSVPDTSVVIIDRIEVFPTLTPFYENQVAASYLEDYESIDGVTGIVSTLTYTTEPIRNISNFIEDELYVSTLGRTFAPFPSDSEPAGWPVKEISDQVGASGPLTEEGGPEYRLKADLHGAWIFDGGNHIKITQEIQQIWDSIYKPSLKTIWTKNDIGQQRILIGIPLPTPNKWLPDAATDATPATPNVVLSCSYLMSPSGRAIAEADPVHVSMFTGSLLWRDMDRKWSIWQIPSPMADWITRADGSEEFWLGGDSTGEIYKLDSTVYTDNGTAIPQTYMPYGFADVKDAEQLQLGSVRKLYSYASLIIEGAGAFAVTAYPENPATSLPAFTQPNLTLSSPANYDMNVPFNVTGNRCFFKFAVDGNAGSYFLLREIVMACQPDPMILVRGWNG